MERMPSSWPERVQKLRPEQIANQATWARVPETDVIKAASHVISVKPEGSSTVSLFNEMDPGISEETVGEGRGWSTPPRGHGNVMSHGRAMR